MKAKPTKGVKTKASKTAKPTKAPSKKPAAKAAKPQKPSRRAPQPQRPPSPAEAKPQAPAAAAPQRPTRVAPRLSPERRLALIAARRRQFQYHRDLLLEKQREFMEAYAVTRGDSRGTLDDGTEDYIDYAVHSYAREFLLSLTELDRKQLLLVEEALRRIDRGEYGRCMQCNEEINPRRLEVAPWARYCVRCQALEERGLLPQQAAPEHGLGEEPGEEAEEGAAEEEGLEADAGHDDMEEEEVLGEGGLRPTTGGGDEEE